MTTYKPILFSKDLNGSMRVYALETIVHRATPDARDGLKPVQRRVIYAMNELGLAANRPPKKSARIVGEVLGKYHPHGDSSVYDAMVRMAQDFSMHMPLVDGQGNFGSIDGDGAAAMRYTEARLSPAGEALLTDIDSDTVEFRPNFDDSLKEPSVLPTVVPNMLLNGATGIAVGMATNIPPHNLGELCNAVVFLAEQWARRDKITTSDLMRFVLGPDFPTGGYLFRYEGNGEDKIDLLHTLYETGAAKIPVQAKVDIEPLGGGRHYIVVTEIPYQTQKSTIMEKIGKEARAGRIEGVVDVRDESDYEGMRLVIESTRGHDPNKVLEQLLQYTQLKSTFGAIMLALVNRGTYPKVLSLKESLEIFVNHRLEVIVRRSKHERAKLEKRLHIVDGLLIALDAIDDVIAAIKKSKDKDAARKNLQKQFSLSEAQAAAIVAMPLGNLANLEIKKLRNEKSQLEKRIKELSAIINSEKRQLEIVIDETTAVRDAFALPRRTKILDGDVVAGEVVTTASLTGPQIVSLFPNQIDARDAQGYTDRGSEGLTSRRTSTPLIRGVANPQDRVFVVTEDGEGLHIPVMQVNGGIDADKKKIVGGGIITSDDEHIVFLTTDGYVKRTKVTDLPTRVGAFARVVGLKNGVVLAAGIDRGNAQIMLFTAEGQAIRFDAETINPQASSSATGVAAIKIKEGDRLVAGAIFDPGVVSHTILATQQGWVKRVALQDWPVQGRGGQGVRSMVIAPKTGLIAAAGVCRSDDNWVDLITEDGRRMRLKPDAIPETNRVKPGEQLVDKDAGNIVWVSALSATYMYRA